MERFVREEMLIGKKGLERLQGARVALFGVGGVGSAAAEALARAGIGAMDLIDHDTVSVSNINRQLCALENTVGRQKIEVVAERLKQISPNLCVRVHPIFFLPETDMDFSVYDAVIDAVDTVSAKIEIAVRCRDASVPMISCMGSGNKLDPTACVVEDLAKTTVCPLARVMRRELKKRDIVHLPVVYSMEEALRPSAEASNGGKMVPGSISFVPPVAGMIAAGEIVRHLLGIDRKGIIWQS